MNCEESEKLLSAFYDKELPDDQHDAVAAHVRHCARCTATLKSYRQLSVLATSSDQKVPDEAWAKISEALTASSPTATRPNAGHQSHGRDLFQRYAKKILQALTAVAVVAAVIFLSPHLFHDHASLTVDFDHYLQLYAVNPEEAAEELFARYPATACDIEAATREVGYRPIVAAGLPEGYKLASIHVLNMPCCKCVKSVCRTSDGHTLVVIEHDAEQPAWFGNRRAEKCQCGDVTADLIHFDHQMAATFQLRQRAVTIVGATDRKVVENLIRQWTSVRNDL